MNFLIYKSSKKSSISEIDKLCDYIKDKKEHFEIITEQNLSERKNGDVLIVLGGDGTILKVTEFAIFNNIPVVGINTGNLGFLTEFEKNDYKSAIDMVLIKNYKEDKRSVLEVKVKGKKYYALNDAVVQRKYLEDYTNLVVNISAYIENNHVDDIKGDGVIVSTPTGSTAYSLSSGGSILAPGIMANSLTPICAHSLHNRPIVFSSENSCTLKITDESITSLFIDGKCVETVSKKDSIDIKTCKKTVCFLRKPESNFYKVLLTKFSRGK